MMSKPITLTPAELRAVQLTLLELLCEVRRICEKCGIRYTIIAGTLLGAVRHGGFLPWDDDADVAMLRREYGRFRRACRTELDRERFYFQDHTNTPGYRWGYGKLRRKDTAYVVCGTEHLPYEQGMWIDIFPLDTLPAGRLGRTLCNFHLFLVRKFLYAEAGKRRDGNPAKRMAYRLMARVPAGLVFRHLGAWVRRQGGKRTAWVRTPMFPTPNREYGYWREWYTKTARIAFEGEVFACPRDYAAYLTFKFGDYMTLPPPEQRRQHQISRLKFTETNHHGDMA